MTIVILAAGVLFGFATYVSIKKKHSDHALFRLRYFLFKMFNKDLYAIWSNTDKNIQTLFHNAKGNAEIKIHGDSEAYASSLFTEGIASMSIKLHEKFKVSSSNMSMLLLNPTYNKQDEVLYFPEQLVYLKYVKSSSRFLSKECLMEAKAMMESSIKSQSFLMVELSSLTCPEMNMSIHADPISIDIKTMEVVFHIAFCYILLALQVYFIAQLDLTLSNNLQHATQISLITILLLSVFQLFNGFEQLIYSVFNFPLWGFIVLIGIAFFNLFFFMILKLMATILKNTIAYQMGNNPDFPIRRHLLFTYMLSHSTILISFYFCLEHADKPVLFMGWTLALVPQIIKNFFCTSRFLMPMRNVAGLYVCLIIFALYQHFFKYNFFYVHMNNRFDEYYAVKIVGSMLAFVFLILWQETCSPHLLFLKFRGTQGEHIYLKSLDAIREEKKIDVAETECIICLLSLETPVESNDWENGLDNEQLVEYIRENKDKEVMTTPCEHYYHTSCMMAWMAVKMECPCCRQKLPPIL